MNRLHHSLLTVALLMYASMFAQGQLLVTTPIYPTDNDSCIILYDAKLGNGELVNVAPPIYAHTGVITNLSTSPTDWRYVIADWSSNIPKALMTPMGDNTYQIVLKPSIREFYNVPEGEVIEKVAFVFRNSDGSKVGRDTDGSDIYADVYPDILSINILLPETKSLLVEELEEIPISAVSPLADTMYLTINGQVVKRLAGNTLTDTIEAASFGHNWTKHWVKIAARKGDEMVADSFSYTVIPAPHVADLPTGAEDGINYTSATTVILSLYAPGKSNAFVIGDFNNWETDSTHYMNITPDGNRFWLELTGLQPKQEYIFQYLVDGSIRIGDPYADKVSDPNDQYIPATTYPNLKPYPYGLTSGIATFLQTDQEPYPWDTTAFTPPAVEKLVIYELLIRDFTALHDYPSLIDTLSYLKNLGINAIELMPVMEFEGNISWGYNPNYSFAVDKYYGTKNGLKQFVEAAHAIGISVILDIVCNHHFNSSPLAMLYWDGGAQRPATENPWLNVIPKHPYNVGNDFNHESAQTRAYMNRLIKYWITEFHVDGYRFDLSKGLTQKNSYPDNVTLWGQYDASRVSILNSYDSVIRTVKSNAYVILEHFADNSEETVLANEGMMLWGNMTYPSSQGAGGYNSGGTSDLTWASYKSRGWTQPNLIAYMESHDEERLMYKVIRYGSSAGLPYNPKDTTTALKRAELAATIFLALPGPKMLWQFEELGYDYSINYPTGTSDSRLAPKPIRWDYWNQWRRRYTYNVFSSLNMLKQLLPVFGTSQYNIDLSTAVKRIWLTDNDQYVNIFGNFDVVEKSVIPDFSQAGTWYEYFTGDTLQVTDVKAPLDFQAGEYRIYTNFRLPKPPFTALEEQDKAFENPQVLVYPNPSEGLFNFEIFLPEAANIYLNLYNIFGELLGRYSKGRFSRGMHTFQQEVKQGDLTGRGIYLYRIEANGKYVSGKIMVQ